MVLVSCRYYGCGVMGILVFLGRMRILVSFWKFWRDEWEVLAQSHLLSLISEQS